MDIENGQSELSAYLKNITLLILGIVFLAFPLLVIPATTDPFILPKQILLATSLLVSLVFFGAKMISEGKVRLKRTPFDLPLFLFTLFVFLSAMFAINRLDSLISFVPLLLAVLAYFIIVNLAKDRSSVQFLLFSLILGATLVSLLSLLSFFKIYLLPLSFTHAQNFSPLGSLLDQALYLALILPLAAHFTLRQNGAGLSLSIVKEGKIEIKNIVAGLSTVVITAGLVFSLYQLFNPASGQKPLILPFGTGFQTAFAAISQDANRIATGFFLGSGFGTYAADFTRFRQAVLNLNPTLWSLTFFRSSSFVLELLATTGVLGLIAYLFLIIRVVKSNGFGSWTKKIQENSVFLSLVLTIIASFILPFNFIAYTLLFLFLGLFAAQKKFFDVELHFVAFKKGLIPISTSPLVTEEQVYTKSLPVSFFVLFTLFSGILGFYIVRFVTSDVIFQNSLVAAAQNKGLETYNSQVNAIKIFPYRDVYYRVYSQTNLALVNSLAAQQPKNSSPSAQIQQTIYTLIQQSINAARTAVALSPQTVSNWQNLSSIYRSLIGFGQNAENFAIFTNQQAILLDPNNPQEYINLGGIYYQLGQWDNAQRQFQIAINLKPDFANAYYNLGHALENKSDLQNALIQYNTVKTLVANDAVNLKKITEEIEALQKTIGEAAPATGTAKPVGLGVNQPPLSISTPSAQLPQQQPPVRIPAPGQAGQQNTVTPTSIPTPALNP